MPSAPSRIALDHSSTPPHSISAGAPTRKQTPAAKPITNENSVI
jgi:hypothetical protein